MNAKMQHFLGTSNNGYNGFCDSYGNKKSNSLFNRTV